MAAESHAPHHSLTRTSGRGADWLCAPGRFASGGVPRGGGHLADGRVPPSRPRPRQPGAARWHRYVFLNLCVASPLCLARGARLIHEDTSHSPPSAWSPPVRRAPHHADPGQPGLRFRGAHLCGQGGIAGTDWLGIGRHDLPVHLGDPDLRRDGVRHARWPGRPLGEADQPVRCRTRQPVRRRQLRSCPGVHPDQVLGRLSPPAAVEHRRPVRGVCRAATGPLQR